MLHFELENLDNGEKKVITVPEDMSIEDLTREIRCEMGLEYTEGTRFHMIIDQQHRIFMQDEATIAIHVDMLWEGCDDLKQAKQDPKYREDFYYAEDKYTLKDLFPQVGADIMYGQDNDHIWCKLTGITNDEDE